LQFCILSKISTGFNWDNKEYWSEIQIYVAYGRTFQTLWILHGELWNDGPIKIIKKGVWMDHVKETLSKPLL
jgi:hypothetical protein